MGERVVRDRIEKQSTYPLATFKRIQSNNLDLGAFVGKQQETETARAVDGDNPRKLACRAASPWKPRTGRSTAR